MNLWHDIPLGENAPAEFNCIIETPRASHNKYEIDKETGLIKLDRANYGPAAYPFDYGFAPQTFWEDNDALDVIVLTNYPLDPGILVKVRPVAIMEMTDSGDPDEKIIAVPVNDVRFDDMQDLADLNKHTLKEYKNFFETYKILKSEDRAKNLVVVSGFKGKAEALTAITRSQELYKEKFGKK